MSWIIERHMAPAVHKCNLPSARARRRNGLARGAIIRCETCGTRWEFVRGRDGLTWHPILTGGSTED